MRSTEKAIRSSADLDIDLDVLLADLVLDNDVTASGDAPAKSPETETSKRKPSAAIRPDPEIEYIPKSSKTAAAEIPKICIDHPSVEADAISPIPEKRGRAHHGPDLARDTNFIKVLSETRPADFQRDPRYARSPFKARILPLQEGTKASLSKAASTKINPANDASKTGKSPLVTRKKKPASRVRPPAWNDMTPELKGVWITLMMRHTLPMKYAGLGSVKEAEFGIPCTAFTLNLDHPYEHELRRAFIAATGSPSRDHPALTLRKGIEYHVGKVVNRVVETCVVTELSPEGRLHCHGLLGLFPHEAVRLTPSGRRRGNNPVLKALRLAGGQWENHRQWQADVEPCATPGWMLYSRKQGDDDLEGASTSQRIQQIAKEKWERYRRLIIEIQTKPKSPQTRQEPE